MKNDGISIREAALDAGTVSVLLSLSRAWEQEGNVYGYVANEASDLEGNRVFLACDRQEVIGYALGHGYRSHQMHSVMAEGTGCFEVEELYVAPAYRSRGVGKGLMDTVCEALRGEYAYITLTTATKNARAILHFYLDEVGMDFWSARLFKKLS